MELSHYQRNKEKILARLRARRLSLTPDELNVLRAKTAAAVRRWYAKQPKNPKREILSPAARLARARLRNRAWYNKHRKSTRVLRTEEEKAAAKKAWRAAHPRPKSQRVRLTTEEKRVRDRADHKHKARNTLRGKISDLRARAKIRAKRKGVPFDFSARNLVAPRLCPVLGIPLLVGPDVPLHNRPSLDRTRPELGYVEGNVVVMSFRANALKSNATVEELRAVLAYMEAHELTG